MAATVNRIFHRLRREQSEIKTPEFVNDDRSLTIYKPGQLKIRLSDIGGCKEEKIELMEIVKFFDKSKSAELGAHIPKGALLHGSRGVGKTLLVKAVAGETNTTLLSYSCGGFMNGDNGAERLAKVFEIAYLHSPCILFLDELQTIGLPRNSRDKKISVEMKSILEELLVQLDGFEDHKENPIIIFAAVDRLSSIDEALQRPGRFDRIIYLGAPDFNERLEIYEIHLRPIKTGLDKKMLAQRYAAMSNGLTCADIASICNEGAIVAGRAKADEVTIDHFDKALIRFTFGVTKRSPFSDKVKRVAAYHNIGHAVVDKILSEHGDIKSINVLPNTNGDFACVTSTMGDIGDEDCKNKAAMLLGGMAAEEIVFGQFSACNHDDMKLATKLAVSYVCRIGMSDFGKISSSYWYKHGWFDKMKKTTSCGDGNYTLMNEEMQKFIETAHELAKKIINEYLEIVHQLAEKLMEKNVLTFDEVDSAIKGKKAIYINEE